MQKNDLHLTVLGWFVFLLLLYGWNRTKTGHEIIYFGLVLIFIFLLSRNWERIKPVLVKAN